MEIIPLEIAHWPEVKSIYQEGIESGTATLETTAPDWENWDPEHLPYSRFVAIENEDLTGWAALTPVSGRRVYGGVAEVSVYIAAHA